MDIEVNIDAEAVERQVTDAILKSALGDKIQAAIAAALKPNAYGRSSPVEDAIISEVQQQVRIICREEIRNPNSDVRKLIEAKLTEALTPEAVAKIVHKFVSDLGLITTEDLA